MGLFTELISLSFSATIPFIVKVILLEEYWEKDCSYKEQSEKLSWNGLALFVY